MGLRNVLGDVAFPSAARGSGSNNSGPLANSGLAADVFLGVHVTAASGTSPTLNCSLEQSDDGNTWTAVPNSGIPQQTAAGNAVAFATLSKPLFRVVYTVGGTTPSFTFRATVMIVP